MKIAFLLIGTNKYLKLARNCADSLMRQVQIPDCKVTCHIFTNIPKLHMFHDPYEYHHVDHNPWPLVTLLRYQYFCQYATGLVDYDYIYYIDADMEAVAPIGNEILGNLVACEHPGLWGRPGKAQPYERNQHSAAFIDPQLYYNNYYFGALQGGKRENFLKMCDTLRQWINEDLSKNFIPVWHDESMMNKYMMENPPDVILNRFEFAHVEKWFGSATEKVKIRTLEKDHAAIRQE